MNAPYLRVQLVKENSILRTWQFSPSAQFATIGKLRHADLQIPSQSNLGFDAFVYWTGDHWNYGSFNVDSPDLEDCEVEIDGPMSINYLSYELTMAPIENLKQRQKLQLGNVDFFLIEKLIRSEFSFKKFLWPLILASLFFVVIVVAKMFQSSAARSLVVAEIPKTPPVYVSTTLKIKQPGKKVVESTSEKGSGLGGNGHATTSGSGNFGPSAVAKGSLSNQGALSSLIGKVAARVGGSKNVILAIGKKAGEVPTSRALTTGGGTQPGIGAFVAAKGLGIGDVQVATIGRGGGDIAALATMGTHKAKDVVTGAIDLIEEETEVGGGLEKEVIAQNIRTHLGQVLYCYERQLSASPHLMGKVAVKFTIGASGDVITQQINQTTLKNTFVENCILQKISKWKFPNPMGGTLVNVVYPFLFKTTD